MNGGAGARRIIRGVLVVCASAITIIALYLAAAVVGALWTGGVSPAAAGGERQYRIAVFWSPIHTDIILPSEGVSVDWRSVLKGAGEPAGLDDVAYLAFGWGSKSFYREVPHLSDVTASVVARALSFDTSLVHVTPVDDPERIEEDVHRCGFTSESSFGAFSYYLGNVRALVDSPRFNAPLAKRLEALGGVKTLLLTHQDDVADHEKLHERFGRLPESHLADGGFTAARDIEWAHGEGIEVYCPPTKSKHGGDPCQPKAGDGPGVLAWRSRMASQEGKRQYRTRAICECIHARWRNWNLLRLNVRGQAKVGAVMLLHALANNILQAERMLRGHRITTA